MLRRLPTSARWLARLAWTGGLGLGVGCAPDELPHFGTLQYESDNFEVWASDGLEACGGTFEYTEGWLAALRTRAGDHAGREPHTFYWLAGDELPDGLCLPDSRACAYASANVIYSTAIPIVHEVAHVELNRPFAPSLLREGAAEVFASFFVPGRDAPVDSLYGEAQIASTGYQTAGRFSRLIIDEYGIDAYFDLHDALHKKSGREAFEVGVADALGVELPTLEETFRDVYETCSADRWRFYDYECSDLPVTPWRTEAVWSDEVDLSCSASDVIGPRDDVVWTLRAFEIPELMALTLTVQSTDETAAAQIFECSADCNGAFVPAGARSAAVRINGGASPNSGYEPGRYWMRIEHAADSDATVTVRLQ